MIISENGNQIHLTISDDGLGMPNHSQDDAENKNLGYTIIESQVQQLRGSFSYQNIETGPGTRFCLTFTKARLKGPGSGLM